MKRKAEANQKAAVTSGEGTHIIGGSGYVGFIG
jgi:hypothetical protein